MSYQLICASIFVISCVATALPSLASTLITLEPQPGKMVVNARVPGLDNQVFALGIPEAIGCREALLLNFPEATIEWNGPDDRGVVSCMWGPGGRISYTLKIIPAEDYVDLEMTINNHTEFFWHDVFSFNCLNPIQAPAFLDWTLDRTYMSKQGAPYCMANTERVIGFMPTVGFYLPDRIAPDKESIFVRGFGSTSPNRTDGSWIVTLSEPEGYYMAATAMDIEFLFDNLDRCCIHAAPSFGNIGPGQSSTTVSRLYLAKGSLDDFLKRIEDDRSELAARQQLAHPTSVEANNAMPDKFVEMVPDDLEALLIDAPIVYVPLGTFEHHGWHLPIGFDGIKAQAICKRAAQQTGGVVLPTFYFGTGGGHTNHKWTLIMPESVIVPLLEAKLDYLASQGFKVVVILTGHYPHEQVDMVHRLAQEAELRNPNVRYIGLGDPEITTPDSGDTFAGDHAGKYETSIAMELNPGWVHLDRLTPDRDTNLVALPETLLNERPTHDPTHPLYAIHGQDPRIHASEELGKQFVDEIVSNIINQVENALKSITQEASVS